MRTLGPTRSGVSASTWLLATSGSCQSSRLTSRTPGQKKACETALGLIVGYSLSEPLEGDGGYVLDDSVRVVVRGHAAAFHGLAPTLPELGS